MSHQMLTWSNRRDARCDFPWPKERSTPMPLETRRSRNSMYPLSASHSFGDLAKLWLSVTPKLHVVIMIWISALPASVGDGAFLPFSLVMVMGVPSEPQHQIFRFLEKMSVASVPVIRPSPEERTAPFHIREAGSLAGVRRSKVEAAEVVVA